MNIFQRRVNCSISYDVKSKLVNILRKRKLYSDIVDPYEVKATTNNGRTFRADHKGNIYEIKHGHFADNLHLVNRAISSDCSDNQVHAIIPDNNNNRLYILGKGPHLKVLSLGCDGRKRPEEIACLSQGDYFRDGNAEKHFVLIYADPIDKTIIYGILNDGTTFRMHLNQKRQWLNKIRCIIDSFRPLIWKGAVKRGIEVVHGSENNIENNIIKCKLFNIPSSARIIKALKTSYGPIVIVKNGREKKITVVLANEISGGIKKDFVFLSAKEIEIEGEITHITELGNHDDIENPFLLKSIWIEIKSRTKMVKFEIFPPWKVLASHLRVGVLGNDIRFFNDCREFFGDELMSESLIKGKEHDKELEDVIIGELMNRNVDDIPKFKPENEIDVDIIRSLKNRFQIEKRIEFSPTFKGIDNHYINLTRIFKNRRIIQKDVSKSNPFKLSIKKEVIEATKNKMVEFLDLLEIYTVRYYRQGVIEGGIHTSPNCKLAHELELVVLEEICGNLKNWIEFLAIVEYADKDLTRAIGGLPKEEIDALLKMDFGGILDKNQKKMMTRWIKRILDHEYYSDFDFELATQFPSHLTRSEIFEYQGRAALRESYQHDIGEAKHRNLQRKGRQLIEYSKQFNN